MATSTLRVLAILILMNMAVGIAFDISDSARVTREEVFEATNIEGSTIAEQLRNEGERNQPNVEQFESTYGNSQSMFIEIVKIFTKGLIPRWDDYGSQEGWESYALKGFTTLQYMLYTITAYILYITIKNKAAN